MTKKLLITCKDLSKIFPSLDEAIINKLNLNITEGDHTAIVGVSGSGKSTLLHLMAGLEKASSGQVKILDQDISFLSQDELGLLRNTHLGFVYQFHHLLPEFSALDNVAMPLIVRRESREHARVQAQKMLDLVGLQARVQHFPGQLSGGERQRVALARALVAQPACVLADEPTGNLDRHTAQQMFRLLKQVNAEAKTAFLIVTHDQELAALADRRLYMEAGRLVDAS